jgi:hypothetical protein
MWTDPTYALRDVAARQAAIARDVAAWRTGASKKDARGGDDSRSSHDGDRNERSALINVNDLATNAERACDGHLHTINR